MSKYAISVSSFAKKHNAIYIGTSIAILDAAAELRSQQDFYSKLHNGIKYFMPSRVEQADFN